MGWQWHLRPSRRISKTVIRRVIFLDVSPAESSLFTVREKKGVSIGCVTMDSSYIYPQLPSSKSTQKTQSLRSNNKNGKMSTNRQTSSAGANDNKYTEVEETSGMIMMAHYNDARMSPNSLGNNNNNNDNNSSALSPEQANAATRTANTSSHAATYTNFNANTPLDVGRPNACSNCSTLGHRRPECPFLPCKH